MSLMSRCSTDFQLCCTVVEIEFEVVVAVLIGIVVEVVTEDLIAIVIDSVERKRYRSLPVPCQGDPGTDLDHYLLGNPPTMAHIPPQPIRRSRHPCLCV